MGAMGLMEFGPYFNYTYYGDEVCRGARCQVFTACINKPEEGNTSLLYSYYWTSKCCCLCVCVPVLLFFFMDRKLSKGQHIKKKGKRPT
ncbi:hypothetical protein E2C01_093718 [Portunus trituberculatus]|uniref:Uncharacterized protein n=1 Tax=Portunus trituberculatus TaxID=210409 RepID=A0A5B7JJV8_PORTR|nr:hypothetical protein [Portunus trituberculatus]